MRPSLFQVLYDTPEGIGGGGGNFPPSPVGTTPPAPAPAPAPGVPAPSIPGQAGAPAGVTPPAAPPAPPRAPEHTFPAHRVNEILADNRRYKEESERYRRMVEAGTGVNLPRPVDPQVAEAREVFAQVMPGLASLEEHAGMLMKFIGALTEGKIDPAQFSRLGDVFGSVDAQWAQQGRRTLDTIATEFKKDFGNDLSPRQRQVIGQQFEAFLLEGNGERMRRYEQGDNGLVNEFVEDWRKEFVNPFRVAAPPTGDITRMRQNATLPPVPRQGGVVPPAPTAPASPDEVHDRAWQTFRQATGR